MAQIWRKLRESKGNTSSTDQLKEKSHVNDESPVISVGNDLLNKSCLITPSIEKLFFPSKSPHVSDPLCEKTQYVTCLPQILNNTKTRKYFLRYLQSSKNIVLANFWLDVHNLQSCYAQLNAEMKNTAMPSSDDFNNQNMVLDGRLKYEDLISNANYSNKILSTTTDCDNFTPNNINCNDEHSKNNNRVSKHCDINNFVPSVIDMKNINLEHQATVIESHHETNRISTININDNKLRLSKIVKQHLTKEIWRIFERYIAVDAEQACSISSYVKENVVTKIKQIHINVDTDCFIEAQEEAFNSLQVEVPGFLSSELHLRHQYELLSYTANNLQDILQSHAALPSFMEFMEQESSQPLLEFWMAATNFRTQMKEMNLYEKDRNSTVPDLTAQNDAMVLYDKYFSLQATHNLGFSDALRFHIESNICDEKGLEFTCFDDAIRIVLYVLQTMFLQKYLKSALYEGYIKDLINSIKNNGHRRTLSGSTCSSDVSSTVTAPYHSTPALNNTLLAGNNKSSSVNNSSVVARDSVSNITIENILICCPESLWKRKHCRLSCGSVNHLGRFESDLVVEAYKTEGRFSRRLKKLVNKDEDRVRLEYAYSMAESVICDVTAITLDANNSPLNPHNSDNSYDIYLEQCFSKGIDPYSNYNLFAEGFNPLLGVSNKFSGSSNPLPGISNPLSGNLSHYSSSTNLSTVSSNSHYNSPIHSPSKSSSYNQIYNRFPLAPTSSSAGGGMSKSSSFSSNLLSTLTGSHSLAHSYSLANFDLGTDINCDDSIDTTDSTTVLQDNFKRKT